MPLARGAGCHSIQSDMNCSGAHRAPLQQTDPLPPAGRQDSIDDGRRPCENTGLERSLEETESCLKL